MQDISKAAAKKALESFLGNVGGALKGGGTCFTSWIRILVCISKRSARDGRNPRTGETIKIAAKKVVKFKAGAELSRCC